MFLWCNLVVRWKGTYLETVEIKYHEGRSSLGQVVTKGDETTLSVRQGPPVECSPHFHLLVFSPSRRIPLPRFSVWSSTGPFVLRYRDDGVWDPKRRTPLPGHEDRDTECTQGHLWVRCQRRVGPGPDPTVNCPSSLKPLTSYGSFLVPIPVDP